MLIKAKDDSPQEEESSSSLSKVTFQESCSMVLGGHYQTLLSLQQSKGCRLGGSVWSPGRGGGALLQAPPSGGR